MNRVISITVLLFLLISCKTENKKSDLLLYKIEQIVKDKQAVVGVSIVENNGKETISFNGFRRFPMQSVFKLHIGLVVLSEVDKGVFTLDQKVKIDKCELLPGLWSPIRDNFPNGVELSLAQVLEYTLSQSDNVGCDALIRMLGGADRVENYFIRNGFTNLSIKINEEVMQSNWDWQFQNWTTPNSATEVLAVYFNNTRKLLSQNSYDFIWRVMRDTSTGASRLKGKLPVGTIVAHKTGWSGTNKTTGITAAVNDIGVVFLPNGNHFFISVFVTDSKEDLVTNELIIADIAKAAWDYFNEETK